MDTIKLENDWYYHFADNAQTDYSAPTLEDAAWIPLPEISDWAVANSVKSGADWFRRYLTLEALETCVRYHLVIERVPEKVAVYINGKHIGDAKTGQPFRADITERVALGQNLIAMQLTPHSNSSGGGFGKILLQPSLCE